MQSPFISLLLCSQAAMDGAAACLETQFTSRTQYFYLDGLLEFLLCSYVYVSHILNVQIFMILN